MTTLLLVSLIVISAAACGYMLTDDYRHRSTWIRLNICAMALAAGVKWVNMLASQRLDPDTSAGANVLLHIAVGSQLLALLWNVIRQELAKRRKFHRLPPTFSRTTGEQPVIRSRIHR